MQKRRVIITPTNPGAGVDMGVMNSIPANFNQQASPIDNNVGRSPKRVLNFLTNNGTIPLDNSGFINNQHVYGQPPQPIYTQPSVNSHQSSRILTPEEMTEEWRNKPRPPPGTDNPDFWATDRVHFDEDGGFDIFKHTACYQRTQAQFLKDLPKLMAMAAENPPPAFLRHKVASSGDVLAPLRHDGPPPKIYLGDRREELEQMNKQYTNQYAGQPGLNQIYDQAYSQMNQMYTQSPQAYAQVNQQPTQQAYTQSGMSDIYSQAFAQLAQQQPQYVQDAYGRTVMVQPQQPNVQYYQAPQQYMIDARGNYVAVQPQQPQYIIDTYGNKIRAPQQFVVQQPAAQYPQQPTVQTSYGRQVVQPSQDEHPVIWCGGELNAYNDPNHKQKEEQPFVPTTRRTINASFGGAAPQPQVSNQQAQINSSNMHGVHPTHMPTHDVMNVNRMYCDGRVGSLATCYGFKTAPNVFASNQIITNILKEVEASRLSGRGLPYATHHNIEFAASSIMNLHPDDRRLINFIRTILSQSVEMRQIVVDLANVYLYVRYHITQDQNPDVDVAVIDAIDTISCELWIATGSVNSYPLTPNQVIGLVYMWSTIGGFLWLSTIPPIWNQSMAENFYNKITTRLINRNYNASSPSSNPYHTNQTNNVWMANSNSQANQQQNPFNLGDFNKFVKENTDQYSQPVKQLKPNPYTAARENRFFKQNSKLQPIFNTTLKHPYVIGSVKIITNKVWYIGDNHKGAAEKPKDVPKEVKWYRLGDLVLEKMPAEKRNGRTIVESMDINAVQNVPESTWIAWDGLRTLHKPYEDLIVTEDMRLVHGQPLLNGLSVNPNHYGRNYTPDASIPPQVYSDDVARKYGLDDYPEDYNVWNDDEEEVGTERSEHYRFLNHQLDPDYEGMDPEEIYEMKMIEEYGENWREIVEANIAEDEAYRKQITELEKSTLAAHARAYYADYIKQCIDRIMLDHPDQQGFEFNYQMDLDGMLALYKSKPPVFMNDPRSDNYYPMLPEIKSRIYIQLERQLTNKKSTDRIKAKIAALGDNYYAGTYVGEDDAEPAKFNETVYADVTEDPTTGEKLVTTYGNTFIRPGIANRTFINRATGEEISYKTGEPIKSGEDVVFTPNQLEYIRNTPNWKMGDYLPHPIQPNDVSKLVVVEGANPPTVEVVDDAIIRSLQPGYTTFGKTTYQTMYSTNTTPALIRTCKWMMPGKRFEAETYERPLPAPTRVIAYAGSLNISPTISDTNNTFIATFKVLGGAYQFGNASNQHVEDTVDIPMLGEEPKSSNEVVQEDDSFIDTTEQVNYDSPSSVIDLLLMSGAKSVVVWGQQFGMEDDVGAIPVLATPVDSVSEDKVPAGAIKVWMMPIVSTPTDNNPTDPTPDGNPDSDHKDESEDGDEPNEDTSEEVKSADACDNVVDTRTNNVIDFVYYKEQKMYAKSNDAEQASLEQEMVDENLYEECVVNGYSSGYSTSSYVESSGGPLILDTYDASTLGGLATNDDVEEMRELAQKRTNLSVNKPINQVEFERDVQLVAGVINDLVLVNDSEFDQLTNGQMYPPNNTYSMVRHPVGLSIATKLNSVLNPTTPLPRNVTTDHVERMLVKLDQHKLSVATGKCSALDNILHVGGLLSSIASTNAVSESSLEDITAQVLLRQLGSPLISARQELLRKMEALLLLWYKDHYVERDRLAMMITKTTELLSAEFEAKSLVMTRPMLKGLVGDSLTVTPNGVLGGIINMSDVDVFAISNDVSTYVPPMYLGDGNCKHVNYVEACTPLTTHIRGVTKLVTKEQLTDGGVFNQQVLDDAVLLISATPISYPDFIPPIRDLLLTTLGKHATPSIDKLSTQLQQLPTLYSVTMRKIHKAAAYVQITRIVSPMHPQTGLTVVSNPNINPKETVMSNQNKPQSTNAQPKQEKVVLPTTFFVWGYKQQAPGELYLVEGTSKERIPNFAHPVGLEPGVYKLINSSPVRVLEMPADVNSLDTANLYFTVGEANQAIKLTILQKQMEEKAKKEREAAVREVETALRKSWEAKMEEMERAAALDREKFELAMKQFNLEVEKFNHAAQLADRKQEHVEYKDTVDLSIKEREYAMEMDTRRIKMQMDLIALSAENDSRLFNALNNLPAHKRAKVEAGLINVLALPESSPLNTIVAALSSAIDGLSAEEKGQIAFALYSCTNRSLRLLSSHIATTLKPKSSPVTEPVTEEAGENGGETDDTDNKSVVQEPIQVKPSKVKRVAKAAVGAVAAVGLGLWFGLSWVVIAGCGIATAVFSYI